MGEKRILPLLPLRPPPSIRLPVTSRREEGLQKQQTSAASSSFRPIGGWRPRSQRPCQEGGGGAVAMASFNSITRKKQGGERRKGRHFPLEKPGGEEGRALLGKRTSPEFVEPANAVDVEEIGRNHQSARPLISRSYRASKIGSFSFLLGA